MAFGLFDKKYDRWQCNEIIMSSFRRWRWLFVHPSGYRDRGGLLSGWGFSHHQCGGSYLASLQKTDWQGTE
jgi:hypothetical protein